jgi:hypothetical protein
LQKDCQQPQLRQVIEGAIAGIPFYREERREAKTTDSGHGRIESRKLVATRAPVESLRRNLGKPWR